MAGSSFLDSLKNIWFAAEDKWYSFLDSLDSKGFPVYKLVDPIDKVVPSFALAVSGFLFLLVFVLFFVFSSLLAPSFHPVKFLVLSDGVPVPGVELVLSQEASGGFKGLDLSLDSDEGGFVVTNLFPSSVSVSVDASGFESFSEEFDLVGEDGEPISLIKINLVKKLLHPSKVSINLRDSDSRGLIKKTANLSFACSTGSAPPNKITHSGSVLVNYPSDCDELRVTVSISGYSDASKTLTNEFETIYLTPIQASFDDGDSGDNVSSFAELSVSVVNQDSLPLPNVLVSLTESNTGFQKDSHLTDDSGFVVFDSIDAGNYVVEVFDSNSGARDSKEIQLVEDDSEELSFSLNTNVEAKRIFLKFIDSNSLEPIEGVRVNVFVNKVLSSITGLSDSSGLVDINFSSDFNQLAVLASNEDFVTHPVNNVELKNFYDEPQEIVLDRVSSDNSGSVLVRVFDDPTKGDLLVPGASVKLFNSRYENLFLAFGESNDSGEAEFFNLPLEGKYKVVASLDSVQGVTDENSLSGSSQTIFEVFLDNPLKFNLNLIVQDKDGVAVSDAEIILKNKFSNESIEGLTRSDGSFSIELPINQVFELSVSKENYLPSFKPILPAIAGEDRTNLVTLYPVQTFTEPELFFEGYYPASNKGNYLDGFVEKNKSYYAVFSLVIPDSTSFSKVVSNTRIDLDSKLNASDVELVLTKALTPNNGLTYQLTSFDPNNIFKEQDSQGAEFKAFNTKYSNVSNQTNTLIVKFFVKNWAHEGEPPIPLNYQNNYRSSTNENTLDKKTEEFIVSNCETCFKEAFLYSFKLNSEPINPNQRTSINLEKENELEVILKNKTFEKAENLELNLRDATIPGLNENDFNQVLEVNPTQLSIDELPVNEEFSSSVFVTGLTQSSNAKLKIELNSKYPDDDETVLFKVIPKQQLLLNVNQSSFVEKQFKYLITGSTQDAEGNKIPGALIKFDHTPTNSNLEIHEQTFSDENGFFEFELTKPLFAPTPLIVSGEAAGYLTDEIELPVRNEAKFDSMKKPDCLKITPSNQELETTRGEITEFEIENNCKQDFEVTISSVNTSDIKFSIGETNPKYSVSTHFNKNDEKKIYVKTNQLAGLHPIYLTFTSPQASLTNFSTELSLTVFPQSTDAFDLMGRDDGRKRYEFNLVNSRDKITALYNGFTPQWMDSQCNVNNLNACPPWVTGLEENTKHINPNNPNIWFKSIDGVEFDYEKVFLGSNFPGLGASTETGILEDALASGNVFAPELNITNTVTGTNIALIKFGINSNDVGDNYLIQSLELKLTASENSAPIQAHNFYNITWSGGDSFTQPINGLDDSSFFTSQETSEDGTILIDLKKAGINYPGIYSIALTLQNPDSTASFYSKESTINPPCLIVNGVEYCASQEDLGDCFFDFTGKSRQLGEDYWKNNWSHLPDSQKPSNESIEGMKNQCVYCLQNTDGEYLNDAPTGCYGDKRILLYNPDGTKKEQYFQPNGKLNEQGVKILKQNCNPYKEQFNYTAKLRVYNATQPKEEELKKQKNKKIYFGTSSNFYESFMNDCLNAGFTPDQCNSSANSAEAYGFESFSEWYESWNCDGEDSSSSSGSSSSGGYSGSSGGFGFGGFAGNDGYYGGYYGSGGGGYSGSSYGGGGASSKSCSELNGVKCSGGTPDCSVGWTSASDGLCCLGSCVGSGEGFDVGGGSSDLGEGSISFSCDLSKGKACDGLSLTGGVFTKYGWYPGSESDVSGYRNTSAHYSNGSGLDNLFFSDVGSGAHGGGESNSDGSGGPGGSNGSSDAGNSFSECEVGPGSNFGVSCIRAPSGKEIDFESPGFIELTFRFIDTPEERASKRFGLLDASWFTRIEKLDSGFPAISNSLAMRKFADYMRFGVDADFDVNKEHTIRFEWSKEKVKLYLDGGQVGEGERKPIKFGGINEPHPFNQKEMAIVIGDNKNANLHANVPNPPVIYKSLSYGFTVSDIPEPGSLGDLVSAHNIGFLSDPRYGSGGVHFSKPVEFLLGEGTVKGMLKDVKFVCDDETYELVNGLIDFRDEPETYADKFNKTGWVFKGVNAPYTGFVTLDELKDKTCSTASLSFYGRNQLVYGRNGTMLFGMHPKEENGNIAWYDFFALLKQLVTVDSGMKLIRFGFYSRNPCALPEQYIWANELGISNANDWLYFNLSWSPGYDEEEEFEENAETKEQEPEKSLFKNQELNKFKALFSTDKTKFLPGEYRDRMDIDLINTGFDGVKYGVIGLADYGNDLTELKTGFFHSKFVGSNNKCVKFTGDEKIVGEDSTGEKAKISSDYTWSNSNSRCNAVKSGVYCDAAQFMQKISKKFETIQDLLKNNVSINSNEYQSTISFRLKLKHDGLSKDMVNDFKQWVLSGAEDLPPTRFIEMQNLYSSNLIDFKLLGENLEVLEETSDSNPSIELEPGVYQVNLEFEFKNSSNPLLVQGTDVKINHVEIILRKITPPIEESILYYLPFDSTMGSTDGSREGYGLKVTGEQSNIRELQNLELTTALVTLNIETIHDFASLNNNELRASIIQIKKESTNNYVLTQTLPYATPVLMLVSDDKYDAFYSLEKGTTNPADGLNYAGIWTGIGSTMTKQNTGVCVGFEENPLPRGFKDATASTWKTDGFETSVNPNNENKSYGLSFKRTDSTGSFPKANTIMLYNVFYTSTHPVYGAEKTFLKNTSTGNAVFLDPKTLQPINSIPLDYKKPVINSIQDLINMVDEKKEACVALEKNSMDLFWNEDKLAFNAFENIVSTNANYCSTNQTQEYSYNEWGEGSTSTQNSNNYYTPPTNQEQNNYTPPNNQEQNNEEQENQSQNECSNGKAIVKVTNITQMDSSNCNELNKQTLFALTNKNMTQYVAIYHRWLGPQGEGEDYCENNTGWRQTWRTELNNGQDEFEWSIWNSNEFNSNELEFEITWNPTKTTVTEKNTGTQFINAGIQVSELFTGGLAKDSTANAELVSMQCFD